MTAIHTTANLNSKKMPKPISWAIFAKKYHNREDSYKYEWVDGYVVKTKYAMNQYQSVLAINLLEFFYTLKAKKLVEGGFVAEVDTFLAEKTMRRPDMVYFTPEQMKKIGLENKNQVPLFVIEIVSSTDQVNALQLKMKNYRDAGIQVVWQIYPKLREVHVCVGETITICGGKTICSAKPVLPHFEITVEDMFKGLEDKSKTK